MNIELLLSRISALSAKYDFINQKTGGYFNIFSIADIETDEVMVCRVLFELLNPKGSHYQGATYLRLFLYNVLGLDFYEEEYSRTVVHREYVIANDRRIDLAISIAGRLIPIEVKIYAGDQNRQCFDYYRVAKGSKVVYLTLDGHPPSPESAHGLTANHDKNNEITDYNEVHQISFQTDIIAWLGKCLECPETIRIAPIREILLQFISVIRKLTNQAEEGMEMEIRQVITASKENLKGALEIEKNLRSCKEEMMISVLSALERGISKQKVDNEYDYAKSNNRLIRTYYDRKGSSYPGITYPCKTAIKPGVDLWFRVEIDDYIFAGFCTPKDGRSKGQQLIEKEIREVLNTDPAVDSWWIYWECLPQDDDNLSPNFKTFNEPYLNLFDKATFDPFIAESIKKIESMMAKMV